MLYRAELLPDLCAFPGPASDVMRRPSSSSAAGGCWRSARVARVQPSTDREGFEPSRAINPTRFPIVLLKPLGHLSNVPGPERRGWDSNPREPFGPDGLANRCRNHLATPPNPLQSATHRAPAELPLLGSNQDSSDPESDVLPVTPRGIGPTSITNQDKRETGFEPATLSLGS